MKNFLLLRALCMLSALLVCTGAGAQHAKEVRGRATDASGRPLAGVTVIEKGTTRGTTTDTDGAYVLRTASHEPTLIFSMLGYATVEVAAGSRTEVDVTLGEEASEIDEVVVVGYGYVRRVDLTGAVASVNTDEMRKAPVRSFDEALAGRVAGVQVTSSEGEPGSSVNIVVRGQNSLTQDSSPLYVVDGFPLESFNTSSLNPADIVSIDVLKDASATAIYGARGANGVIMVTTRSGHAGRTQVSYEGSFGLQNTTNRMELMDPYEFVKLQLEIDPYQARKSYLKPNSDGLDTRTADYYRYAQHVDWQKRVLQVAPMHNHTVSLTGGSKAVKYAASLNYMGQEGVVRQSGYDRVTGRLRLDVEATKHLKVGFNTSYSWTSQYGTSVRMPSSNAEASLTLMYNMWGYRPVTGGNIDDLLNADEDTEIVEMTTWGNRYNPMLYLNNEQKDYAQNTFAANVYGEYRFGKYLKLRVSGGINRNTAILEDFFNSKHPYSQKIAGIIKGVNGYAQYEVRQSLLNENTLTFDRTFNRRHHLNILGGVTVQEYKYFSFRGTAWNVPRESLGIAGLDEGEAQPLNSSKSLNRMVSGLFRLNYDFSRKYYVTFSFRADGSSKFPAGNKWGYFPSASLSYRLSQENFLRDSKVISDAKIRLSYGLTGNNRVGDFAYMSQLNLSNLDGYTWNNRFVQGAQLASLGNYRLKWESTRAADVGLDLALFDSRISLTMDYYTKKTYDLLLNANLPLSSGYQRAMMNVGAVRNYGFELTLNTVNVETEHFRWTTNFNISLNRSRVLGLADGEQKMESFINWNSDYQSVPLYETRVGQPVTRFVGMVWDGLYQISDFTWQNDSDPSVPHESRQYVLRDEVPDNGMARNQIRPGYIRFRDFDGDGHVGSEDRRVLGDPNPSYTGGFSNSFVWRNFDLNLFFQFSGGNKIMNANRILFEGTYRYGLNQFASYVDRWSPENPRSHNYVPGGQKVAYYSDKTLEDGSYLRLKTVQIGYTLPRRLLARLHISRLRIYLAAQNLCTWTAYSGYDPEVSIYNSPLTPGFDYLSYPRSRTWTVGLNLSF
ncbi:SusC/RagA family TonB-linked outer membrane protein [Alistipes sp.]|uniref:SusC/RagA family TonB-linked outer membrane protein n=1 Tax=Alistipes sp. TaxID=1872444 RepID=UPI003AF1AE46